MAIWSASPKKPPGLKPLALPSIDSMVQAESLRRRDDAQRVYHDLPAYLRVKPDQVDSLANRVQSQAMLEAVLKWNPRLHGNLLILAATGAGKSSAGGLKFRNLLATGIREGGVDWEIARGMVWVDTEELAREVRVHGRGRGEAKGFNKAVDASLLFLDEVGSEAEIQTVTDLVAMRYKRQRPTVIMSGQTKEGLSAHYGAPVVRKMRQAGGRASTLVEHMSLTGPAEVTWPTVPTSFNEPAERVLSRVTK